MDSEKSITTVALQLPPFGVSPASPFFTKKNKGISQCFALQYTIKGFIPSGR
jgi:hypothetical protein